MNAALTYIPLVEQLSSRVIRILGCNAGPKTLQGTNTYLIGQGTKRVLIDTSGNVPNLDEYVKTLKKELQTRNCSIQEILITHWHLDHIGGVGDIIKSVISEVPIRVSKFKRMSMPEFDHGISYNYINDNHLIEVEGVTLQAIYTPGHTEDHLCFYLKEENAIFSGDCILGETSAVFEDLHDYMNSLRKIKDLKADLIYPGHGPVIRNAIARIDEYISHRNKRNEQILNELRKSVEPLTADELVARIYIGLDEKLVSSAVGNINNHLIALKKQNLVVQVDEHSWKLLNEEK